MPEKPTKIAKRPKRSTSAVFCDQFDKLGAPDPKDAQQRSERVDVLANLAERLGKLELDNLVWLIDRAKSRQQSLEREDRA